MGGFYNVVISDGKNFLNIVMKFDVIMFLINYIVIVFNDIYWWEIRF